MQYKRPDKEQIKKDLAAIAEKLEKAKTYIEAKAAFIEHDELERHMTTQFTLASIRNSVDTRDEFYDAEVKYSNSAFPEIAEYEQMFVAALLKSPFRKEFIADYGDRMFIDAEMQIKAFSPEIIPESQKENDLTREYENLLASAQIEFDGGVYTLSQLTPFKTSADDDVRLRAWTAEGAWYKKNQEKLDSIYDELVSLRDTMGRKMGYKGYTELGYYRMTRDCYNKDDVEKFRKAVVKYLVPVADSIYRKQAQRLNKTYPMNFADNALMFRSGNARPAGSADDIVAAAGNFYDELSPETSEFFRTMRENELMSLLSTEGKQGGGYCTGIPDYSVPFIFANFNGTRDDVEVLTHEGGHAFECWLNRNRVPLDSVWPSMEACEVHSMSMEFFSWPWAEEFFKGDTRKFLYSHLAGSLTFIPYGTAVDHFQHIVYENPSLTPRERHAEWKKLLGIYMPWIKLDGEIPFYGEGEDWQLKHHIYSSPFYYIDYCFAQTVALQFWAMIQKDLKGAWKKYMAYTSLGGSRTFTELLSSAGLDSPFDENCLKNVCAAAKEWLDSFDLTGIE